MAVFLVVSVLPLITDTWRTQIKDGGGKAVWNQWQPAAPP